MFRVWLIELGKNYIMTNKTAFVSMQVFDIPSVWVMGIRMNGSFFFFKKEKQARHSVLYIHITSMMHVCFLTRCAKTHSQEWWWRWWSSCCLCQSETDRENGGDRKRKTNDGSNVMNSRFVCSHCFQFHAHTHNRHFTLTVGWRIDDSPLGRWVVHMQWMRVEKKSNKPELLIKI